MKKSTKKNKSKSAKKTKELIKHLKEEYGHLLFMDGFDDAVEGVVIRFGLEYPLVCYNLNKVLDILEDQGMSLEDAYEFFEYNQLGSWVGEQTPCFIIKHNDDV